MTGTLPIHEQRRNHVVQSFLPRRLVRTIGAGLGAAILSATMLAGTGTAHAADSSLEEQMTAEVVALAEREFGLSDRRRPEPPGAAPSVGLRSVGPSDVGVSDVAVGHSVSGSVFMRDPGGVVAPAEGVLVELSGPWEEGWDEEELDEDEEWVPDEDMLFVETLTAADGTYSFADVPDGEYTLWFDAGEESIYLPDYLDVTVAGGDLVADDLLLTPVVPLGDLETRGSPVVGKTLELVPSNWIAGTSFTYMWAWGRISDSEISVGLLDDADGNSYTVTPEHIGAFVVVVVLAENPGYDPLITGAMWEEPISAPRKAPAPAPVADSDGLGAFLVSHGSTPRPQTAAGLPSGSLNPQQDYTAVISWDGPDSFVDVYGYSTPVFVGTFPVVDGSVAVELDAATLTELGGGAHTLVLLGQSSGDVGSLRLDIAAMLAATGAAPAPALGAGALLTVFGVAGIAFGRRRRAER